MNEPLHLKPKTARLAVILALLSLFCHQSFSKDAVPKKQGKFAPIQVVPELPIPQSDFVVPTQPSEGRNPFFPLSSGRAVVPPINRETPFDITSFVLNGITSPPRRTAMINGRTFDLGEEGEVRLPSGGRMLIKVEEIKSDSAVIFFGGQRHELRLRAGV
jgi:hypothetical protein